MILHPRFSQLCRFVEHEIAPAKRKRLTAHLARCPRCRAEVAFLRELSEAAQSIPAPEPPADALTSILARRIAGERMILPSADLETVRSPRVLPAAVAALILIVVGAGILFRTPELEAENSELRFTPAAPRAGQEVTVE